MKMPNLNKLSNSLKQVKENAEKTEKEIKDVSKAVDKLEKSAKAGRLGVEALKDKLGALPVVGQTLSRSLDGVEGSFLSVAKAALPVAGIAGGLAAVGGAAVLADEETGTRSNFGCARTTIGIPPNRVRLVFCSGCSGAPLWPYCGAGSRPGPTMPKHRFMARSVSRSSFVSTHSFVNDEASRTWPTHRRTHASCPLRDTSCTVDGRAHATKGARNTVSDGAG